MKMVKVLVIGLVSATILAVIIALCVTSTSSEETVPVRAVVVFNTGVDKSGVNGILELSQKSEDSPVNITGTIHNLPANSVHGFHVHENGDIREACKSTGGHFNPEKHDHAGPEDEKRHVGDLGNVESDAQGVADIKIMDSRISLSGPNSIIGRAFVIHENKDDLGRGGHDDSKKTGNAGARIGCGLIGVLYPKK